MARVDSALILVFWWLNLIRSWPLPYAERSWLLVSRGTQRLVQILDL